MHAVPTLLGTNQDEGTEFVHLPLDANASDFEAYAEQNAPGFGAAVAAQYPLSSYKKTTYASAAWCKLFELDYKTPLLRWFWTCFYAAPLLLGWMEEEQQRCVEMAPRFFNPRSGAAARARVALSECGLEVYEASLRFQLHFDRLGYVMHTWYFSSAVVGVGALMLVQV